MDADYTVRIESVDSHVKVYTERFSGAFTREILTTTNAELTIPRCECTEIELWSDEAVVEHAGETLWRGPIDTARRVDGGLQVTAVDVSGYLERTVSEMYSAEGDYAPLMRNLIRSTWLAGRFPLQTVATGREGIFEWTQPRIISPLLTDLATAGVMWQAIGPTLVIGPDTIYDQPVGPLVVANTVDVDITRLDVVRQATVVSSRVDPDEPNDRIPFWGSFGGGGPQLLIENDTVPDEDAAVRLAKRYVDAPDRARATAEIDPRRTPIDLMVPGRVVSVVSDDCWSLENGTLESVAWQVSEGERGEQVTQIVATVIIGDLAEVPPPATGFPSVTGPPPPPPPPPPPDE